MSDQNERCVRVAFAGASGTGKSTLASRVAERYDLEMNPVGSRSVSQAMGFASPYDVDMAGRRAEFQRRLLTEKVAWEKSRERFVTDRTTVDCLTYAALHDVAAVDEEMLAAAVRGARQYTHVVFCPIDGFHHVGDDPARLKERTYHEVCDAVIRGFLAKFVAGPVPVLFLGAGTVDERAADVFRFVDGG